MKTVSFWVYIIVNMLAVFQCMWRLVGQSTVRDVIGFFDILCLLSVTIGADIVCMR